MRYDAAADRLGRLRDALGCEAIQWDYVPGYGSGVGRWDHTRVVVPVDVLEALLDARDQS